MSAFFPGGSETWERVAPSEAGFDPAALAAATRFATEHQSPWPPSLFYPDGRYVGNVEWNETGPWSEVVGPVRERGGPAGLILKGGRIAAEWGDIARPDLSFSIAKSYLAVLAGIASDDGLIPDIDEPVRGRVDDPLLTGPHNGRITWRQDVVHAVELLAHPLGDAVLIGDIVHAEFVHEGGEVRRAAILLHAPESLREVSLAAPN
jgi:hypothetical protein